MEERVVSLGERARSFLDVGEPDMRRLRETWEILLPGIDDVIGRAASSLLADPEAREIVTRASLSPERAAALFKVWLNYSFNGNFDRQHAMRMFMIGLAHARVGVPERVVIMTVGAFLRELSVELAARLGPEEYPGAAVSVSKALLWGLALMLESYEEVRVEGFTDVTGMRRELYERTASIHAKRLYDELSGSF